MGSLAHKNQGKNISGAIPETSHIPEYAREYKRVCQYIKWINEDCGEFLMKLDFGRDILNGPLSNRLKRHIKKFLQAQEHGRLKDISGFYFKYFDANNIECLEEQLDNYRDFYVNPDSYEFEQERYESSIDIDYPGFKELFELVSLLNDKIKKEDCKIILPDSESESESDNDDNDVEFEINLSDSNSDSDSDVEINLSVSDSD